jgi:hypothetical protein
VSIGLLSLTSAAHHGNNRAARLLKDDASSSKKGVPSIQCCGVLGDCLVVAREKSLLLLPKEILLLSFSLSM